MVITIRRRALRNITAADRERLSRLADILYNFLPMNTYMGAGSNFRKIFEESRIDSYLKQGNKKEVLKQGLTKLIRYHSRLPYKIMRRIVEEAIDYRIYKRNPLTREELDDLADCLYELKIDMRKEFKEVKLDKRLPEIVVPPQLLKRMLEKYSLVPKISSDPLALFMDGHFNEAVRKATERFEDVVREKSGLSLIGQDLMTNAFSTSDLLAIDRLKPKNENNFTNGYKFLAMGLMRAIRNVFSHGDEEKRTPEECFEMLLFLNWMFRVLK